MTELLKTIRLRIKDKHRGLLSAQAEEVNTVWNFCNETAIKVLEREQRFCTNVDLDKLTSGATKGDCAMTLHSQTVQAISKEYATRRFQFKKRRLNWRKSGGARRSLGWVPFKEAAIRYKNGQLHYQNKPISLWDSYGLSKFDLHGGSFSEDAQGRWYVNIVIKQAKPEYIYPQLPKISMSPDVGIDLGCKEAVNTSDGQKLIGRQYRRLEKKLAMAQRANKKKQVKTISAQIKNRRKDELHQFSSDLVKHYDAIYVGNVSSLAMVKTNNAKSALDAGWGMFRIMLEYKCENAGIKFVNTDERFTTQTCSWCLKISDASPKGMSGLGKRSWVCTLCGTKHNRDTNASLNIRRIGRDTLHPGIPRL